MALLTGTARGTIPVRAAHRFTMDLLAAGGEFNDRIAQELQGRISVAELSGRRRIDVEAAILEALAELVPSGSELDSSIDHMVDLVIDVR